MKITEKSRFSTVGCVVLALSLQSLRCFLFMHVSCCLELSVVKRVVGIHSRNAARFSGYFGKLSVLPARPVGYARLSTTRAAIGIRHLMMRDPKTGKLERITGNAKQIDKAIKSKNACWIYTKDPNIAAFTDLLNRAIDKPAEHIQVAGEGNITIRWQKDEQKPWSWTPRM